MPAKHERQDSPVSGFSEEDLLGLHYAMRLTRAFEENITRLYQQGKIVGGAYSGYGNEATSVGSAYALADGDYILPLHRDMGAHIVRGQTLERLMLQYLGRQEGMTRGRDGTGHYVDIGRRIIGNISHLGAMVPVAAGLALASRLKKETSVVMTYIGDGGSNVGEVHEGLAMASVMRLPLLLVIENNQYAYSTPTEKQFLVKKLSERAAGYGIEGVTVDGTDVLAVVRACREAVERARQGRGPSVIESVTMRMAGHAAHDNAWYVPKELLETWKKKDPVNRFEKLLMDQGALSREKKDHIAAEVQTRVEDATKIAMERPFPAGEEASIGVWAKR